MDGVQRAFTGARSERQRSVEPVLEVLPERPGDPPPAVDFVVPDEYVVSANLAVLDWISKLITVACVGKEQQVIERHVEFAKVFVAPEFIAIYAFTLLLCQSAIYDLSPSSDPVYGGATTCWQRHHHRVLIWLISK